eukprot:CAMPEP_0180655074 /NCGR_PEP_ID=MMETSP1037_2-20121125/55071_1 /TAXON_ID=632150 /ORGANISM="Azadinium spinosum, Strain 3D9" /LENGTH=115 /DNA_ID=CAMNT_0022681459 /DNA_START=385 /DNA_END=730 /DNA_ORIENTATION=+
MEKSPRSKYPRRLPQLRRVPAVGIPWRLRKEEGQGRNLGVVDHEALVLATPKAAAVPVDIAAQPSRRYVLNGLPSDAPRHEVPSGAALGGGAQASLGTTDRPARDAAPSPYWHNR